MYSEKEASVACLDHARTMLIHASEVRSKNFNFFLVASGFIILAFTNVSDPVVIRIVAGAGVVLSIIFILLDIRTFQLIKDARHDLETGNQRRMHFHGQFHHVVEQTVNTEPDAQSGFGCVT